MIDSVILQLTAHEGCLRGVFPCVGDAKKRKDGGEDADMLCTSVDESGASKLPWLNTGTGKFRLPMRCGRPLVTIN